MNSFGKKLGKYSVGILEFLVIIHDDLSFLLFFLFTAVQSFFIKTSNKFKQKKSSIKNTNISYIFYILSNLFLGIKKLLVKIYIDIFRKKTLKIIVIIGWLSWLWFAFKLGSILMFFLGFIPILIIFTSLFGSYFMLFGTPNWFIGLFNFLF